MSMAIEEDVVIGNNTKIHHPELVNLYGCTIGDDCVIGSFVEIRKGVKIGDRVKIQAGAFIPEGVEIADEVFIGPHVVFTNDLYPRATNPDGTLQTANDWELKTTSVKRRASIGANATILCGITIGEEAMIGAGSVVTKDVPAKTIVAGNPARAVRTLCESE